MSNFPFYYVLVCNSVVYLKEKGFCVMYIAVTGSKNNKDVYIYQSFRKEDGKSSSRIYKKLGKYNSLLEQFNGDDEKLMAWAKSEAAKETELYNERTGTVTVEFSQAATRHIPFMPVICSFNNYAQNSVLITSAV